MATPTSVVGGLGDIALLENVAPIADINIDVAAQSAMPPRSDHYARIRIGHW
jgi:hypothetical protein